MQSRVSQLHNRTTSSIQATLWADNPDVTAILPKLFAHVGISVTMVSSAAELLQAADHARPGDILVIDCTTAFDAVDRCTAVVGHTLVPLYICHTDQCFVDDLRPQAGGSLYWLSPAWIGLSLLWKMRMIKTQATAISPVDHTLLSDREYDVWRLTAEGLSDRQVGDRLYICRSTVKTEVSRIKEKLGLATRADLITEYHRTTHNR